MMMAKAAGAAAIGLEWQKDKDSGRFQAADQIITSYPQLNFVRS
jgi:phosphoglycolate phosphatase-like HAD superfamily hydrolase